MVNRPTRNDPVALVVHFHDHPVEDTDFHGCVVHAMPADYTAWGTNADMALQNFDAMLEAVARNLGSKADEWRASLLAEYEQLREAVRRDPRPQSGPEARLSVRSAGGLTYLLVQAVHDEACTPCG